jgi:hypothetical protein
MVRHLRTVLAGLLSRLGPPPHDPRRHFAARMNAARRP